MKYRVLKDNFGFKDFYWHQGQIVELDPSEKPPKYFELLDKPIINNDCNMVSDPVVIVEEKKPTFSNKKRKH